MTCPRCEQASVLVDHATWVMRAFTHQVRVYCLVCGLSQWLPANTFELTRA